MPDITTTTPPDPEPVSTQDPQAPPRPLASAPLAYENPTFLNSSDGRLIRIVAEYMEPLARFRHELIQDTVVFFGSARIHSREVAEKALAISTNPANTTALAMSHYYEDARQLSHLLAAWAKQIPSRRARFVVTSGGGPGIMEAANRGAHEAGGKTIGLNIRLPFEQAPNPYITPSLNFEFHYFFMRKLWFAYLAKALVVFPGGFGTMDEMFEILTLAQTHKLAKKITVILYGSEYWNKVINLQAFVDAGTVSAPDLSLFSFANSPEAAFDLLKKGLTENHLIPEAEARKAHPELAEPNLLPGWSLDDFLGPEIAKTRK